MTQARAFSLVVAICLSSGLSACMSSSAQPVTASAPTQAAPDPATPTPPPTSPTPTAPTSPPAFLSANAPAQTVTGDAISIRKGEKRMSLGTVSGTLGGSGQSSLFTGPIHRILDPNGPDANGRFKSGQGTLETDGTQYSHARIFIAKSAKGGSAGILGLPHTDPLPKSGTARYLGTGLISEAGTHVPVPVDQTAKSQVNVNFASGRVDAKLDVPLQSRNTLSNVTRMTASNMALSDGRFSGSTVRVFNKGKRFYPTGTGNVSGAAGRFYGPSGTNGPAEVGGVMHISGPKGIVTGIFLAK